MRAQSPPDGLQPPESQTLDSMKILNGTSTTLAVGLFEARHVNENAFPLAEEFTGTDK